MSTFSQKSFAGGELSPALYGRVDTIKYATGARTIRNFFVMRHGGVTNRPGTEFVGEVKDSTKTVRLIPFVFNADQTYVLEFGDQYMRVIRNGGVLTLASQAITAISNASTAVVTYSGTDTYTDGDEVYLSGISGAISTLLNGRNFKISGVDTGANTFEINYMDGTPVDSTSAGAYVSGGTVEEIYTIATPYVEADLSTIQFVQSADVITIVHPSYAPRELSRSGHTSWSFSTITFGPGIAAPGSPTATPGGTTGSTSYDYKITAVQAEDFEESLPSTVAHTTTGNATISTTNFIDVGWSAVSGAVEYNIYKALNGIYGFIGVGGGTTFRDTGIVPDTTDTPPSNRDVFNATGDYPSAVSYFQQRLLFGNSDNDPENVWASKTGQFHNFTVSTPIQDDDSISFALAGRQVNEVRHLIDLGKLLVFTSGGEWAVEGDVAGILKPTDINAKQYSYNGSSTLAPIIIGENALYLQQRGSIVRDLGFDYQVDGYRGNDLTIFSAHLFDNYSIADWTYQQIPHSIVWAVRSDGRLLGLTYVREHQVFGWHHHDFPGGNGFVENVCSVPEGNEDALYLVILRTINGADVRYIERLSSRQVNDVIDNNFTDVSLMYDGRNTGSRSMTLTGSGWTYEDTLILTSSTSFFSAAEVGNEIQLNGSDGTLIRFSITGYTSGTVVTGRPNKNVPLSMQGQAILDWARAVDQLSGLWHIEGEDVAVFADRFVVASPNNDQYVTITVGNGIIELDRPYAVIRVGLPYISDLYTLDIDTAQGETIADKSKWIGKLTMFVQDSRGIWAGASPPSDDEVNPKEDLDELKIRDNEGYDDPVSLATGTVEITLKPEWNSNGRVFIRQLDPIPLSVLAVAPAGYLPFSGKGGG